MKLTAAIAFFAIAAAGVDATKPAMHGGRLTLQDLLALRNGVMLPEMSEWFPHLIPEFQPDRPSEEKYPYKYTYRS